ncbi:hypothetical protein GQX74_002592 [Glossina fuscipes]|nr:hypothetical protein GQX74_002592 [Glossina fuscipes]
MAIRTTVLCPYFSYSVGIMANSKLKYYELGFFFFCFSRKSHCDYIRYDAVSFESPIKFTGASETGYCTVPPTPCMDSANIPATLPHGKECKKFDFIRINVSIIFGCATPVNKFIKSIFILQR